MRKNRLIEEMNNVIERNNRLYSKCEELENALKEKNTQVAELTAAYAEVLAENDLLKAELKNLAETSDESCTQVTEFPVLEMSDVVSQHLDEDVEEVKEDKQPEQPVEIDPVYASTALISEAKIKTVSQAIGRVVLECAKLCNTFASIGDINSKDLINLALGRTEVFKSEVLQLATEGRDAESIQSELSEKEKAVLEYFDLLKNQI